MSNHNNFFNVLAAVIVGALIGAVSALLYAPESGKRTRKKLNRKLRDINENLEDLVTDSKHRIALMTEDAEHNFSDLVKKGKKLVNG
ncbi:YtxH domain-containing protein [Rapidithrix thailandica]|uniref:YtxH domain-containing protein n=1 Tax=Rapidithrix thailandica TaxID=413964 RepID=A0AAW9S257_9BACT